MASFCVTDKYMTRQVWRHKWLRHSDAVSGWDTSNDNYSRTSETRTIHMSYSNLQRRQQLYACALRYHTLGSRKCDVCRRFGSSATIQQNNVTFGKRRLPCQRVQTTQHDRCQPVARQLSTPGFARLNSLLLHRAIGGITPKTIINAGGLARICKARRANWLTSSFRYPPLGKHRFGATKLFVFCPCSPVFNICIPFSRCYKGKHWKNVIRKTTVHFWKFSFQARNKKVQISSLTVIMVMKQSKLHLITFEMKERLLFSEREPFCSHAPRLRTLVLPIRAAWRWTCVGMIVTEGKRTRRGTCPASVCTPHWGGSLFPRQYHCTCVMQSANLTLQHDTTRHTAVPAFSVTSPKHLFVMETRLNRHEF
jgi:hypothetical protein